MNADILCSLGAYFGEGGVTGESFALSLSHSAFLSCTLGGSSLSGADSGLTATLAAVKQNYERADGKLSRIEQDAG